MTARKCKIWHHLERSGPGKVFLVEQQVVENAAGEGGSLPEPGQAPEWRTARRNLFIAQGFDGVEFGGFHRRPDAENEADTDADGDARGSGPKRHDALPGKGHADQDHEAVDEKQGDQAAGARQGHSFEQELPGDVATFRAHGLAHTDFPGALGDTDEHDVHHTDAADEQPNRTQDDGRERDFVDNVMELLHLLLGGSNGEIVGTAEGNAPTPLEHYADLIDGLFEHTGIRLRAKIDVIGGGINLLHGVEGEEHTAVFFVGAESALSLFQNADDLKGGAINEGVLSDSTTLREEHGRDIFAEEHDFFLVQVVTFADEAALAQSGIGIDDPEIGLHATKVDRRYPASPGANGMRRFPRRSDPGGHTFHRRAGFAKDGSILDGQGFALAFLESRRAVVAVLPLADEGGVGADLLNFFFDFLVEAGNQRGNQHDHADPEDDTEDGEGAAQFVRAQGVHGLQE